MQHTHLYWSDYAPPQPRRLDRLQALQHLATCDVSGEGHCEAALWRDTQRQAALWQATKIILETNKLWTKEEVENLLLVRQAA